MVILIHCRVLFPAEMSKINDVRVGVSWCRSLGVIADENRRITDRFLKGCRD